MTIHPSELLSNTYSRVRRSIIASQHEKSRCKAWQATTFDDFKQITLLVKQVSWQKCIPVDPNRIGHILSWLNHGGSGPETGCAVMAQSADGQIGFALVLVKPDTGLELTWLHAENNDEEIVESLWQKILPSRLQKWKTMKCWILWVMPQGSK